jgi:site-specific recombinase XerD
MCKAWPKNWSTARIGGVFPRNRPRIGRPLHRSTVNLALRKYSAVASLPLLAHPHMLRYACGFALADRGADTRLIQDYLGHRNIQQL